MIIDYLLQEKVKRFTVIICITVVVLVCFILHIVYLKLNPDVQVNISPHKCQKSLKSLDPYLGIIYDLVDQDTNLHQVLEHAGISRLNLMQNIGVEFAMVLNKEEDEFVLTRYYSTGPTDLRFRIGEEFNEETIHFNTYISVLNIDKNKLIHIQRYHPIHPGYHLIPSINTTRIFTEEQVTVEISVDGYKSTLKYSVD